MTKPTLNRLVLTTYVSLLLWDNGSAHAFLPRNRIALYHHNSRIQLILADATWLCTTRGGDSSEEAIVELVREDEEESNSSNEPPEIDSKGGKAVGLKKKSNAVGDPSGEDDDDDDDDDLEAEWEELRQQQHIEEVVMDPEGNELQVELNVVEGDSGDRGAEEEDPGARSSVPAKGLGIGLRLAQRLQMNPRNLQRQRKAKDDAVAPETRRDRKEQILEAWKSFTFTSLPELSTTKCRLYNGASKIRLDRRTLYAGLLMEWNKTNERKFLSPETCQALQSAISLATQPAWREVLKRPNAIRLYGDNADEGCTLSMQETIAMAMVGNLQVQHLLV